MKFLNWWFSYFSIILLVSPCRTYAIYAADSANDLTGLEYDNTCIGDGGIKIIISDGII